MSRRLAQLGLVVLYSFVLLLALRFCGGTYPGWYFPNSVFLNDLLNGTLLFTGIGYDLVIASAAVGTARIFIGADSPGRIRLRWWLGAAQASTVVLVVAIICYGVWWANSMERLPWQLDGHADTYLL